MIRWKVVTQTRKSCYVDNAQYSLLYPKGIIVTALENTLGIMTFKRKKDADDFTKSFKRWLNISHNSTFIERTYEIIRVWGIGRGKVPKRVSTWTTALGLAEFYMYSDNPIAGCAPPSGTICYKQVKVLD